MDMPLTLYTIVSKYLGLGYVHLAYVQVYASILTTF